MKCFLVGKQSASYTKKDGTPVVAINLHTLREVPRGLSGKAEGQLVHVYFVQGPDLVDYINKSVPVGSLIDVEIEVNGRYESVLDVNVVEAVEK